MDTKTAPGGAWLGPNAHLVGDPAGRRKLNTPALVLDLDILEANIARMSALSRQFGVAVRPHAKCHKSVAIARRQIEAGAVGVCCATIGEAEVMAKAGIRGILVTSPIVSDDKIDRALRIAALDDRFCLVVDNPENAAAISARFVEAGRTLSVLVDVDAGMQRTGVADQRAAIELVRRIKAMPGLKYRGLQCYAGHLQHVANDEQRQCASLEVMGALRVLREELTAQGLAPEIVSGSGTGTFDIDGPSGVLTELQVGSYALMDMQYNKVWTDEARTPPFPVALFVQAAVISNNHAGVATCDAGLKHFGVDGGIPFVARGAPAGTSYMYTGDEHGRIQLPCSAMQLALDSRIEFVVPHCDPTVNLYNLVHCVRGEELVDIWPIDARGA